MTTLEASIEVPADSQRAYEMLTEFEHYPEFMVGVEAVRRTGATLMHWTTTYGGHPQEWDAQVVQMDPEQKIIFQGIHMDPPVRSTITFTPSGEGTRITYLLENDPGDPAEVQERLVQSLQRFKEIIDHGPPHRWPSSRSASQENAAP